MELIRSWLNFEYPNTPQWSHNWINFDSTELFSTVNLSVIEPKHQQALFWALTFIIFQLIISAFDVRRRVDRAERKSRILPGGVLGFEPRHVLIGFNGLLLYLTLIFM